MDERQTCDRCGEEFERSEMIVLQNGTGMMDEVCYRETQAEVEERTGADERARVETDEKIEAEFREMGREEALDTLRIVHRYLSSQQDDESLRLAHDLEGTIDLIENLLAEANPRSGEAVEM